MCEPSKNRPIWLLGTAHDGLLGGSWAAALTLGQPVCRLYLEQSSLALKHQLLLPDPSNDEACGKEVETQDHMQPSGPAVEFPEPGSMIKM